MRVLYLVAAASLTVACASSPKTTAEAGTAAAPASATPRRDRNVLLRTELTEVQVAEMNALQAIRQFRPNFFTGGSSPSLSGAGGRLMVYVENIRQGGPDALTHIRMTEVERIEFMSASEATLKYGTGHTGGAIVVRRRR